MKDVIRLEPSISGCNAYSCGTLTAQLIAATEGLVVVAIPVSIVVISAIYHKRMKYLATQNMSNATMNSNRMLMRSLLIHVVIIVVFLVIPVMMLIGIAVIGNEEYNIILEVILVLFTCHSIFDIPALLFFIKPYRVFIRGILLNALRKVGLDKFLQNDQVIVIQVQSSTGIISIQNRSNFVFKIYF
jgi:hypothetical protein